MAMNEAQLYIEARQRFMADADALAAPFFYFSPANILPKLWAGKLVVASLPDRQAALVSPDGSYRVIPQGSREAYYGACLFALARGPIVNVPEWVTRGLKNLYKASLQHREFIIPTRTTIDYPGGSLKSVRRGVNGAEQETDCEQFEPRFISDYLALNATWYAQAKGRKFRTYDKLSIDLLLSRWREAQAGADDLVCLGIRSRETGKLCSLHIGSKLTDSLWTAYTQRYDRDEVRAANRLGVRNLSRLFLPIAAQNNGTADTKDLRVLKMQLGSPLLASYRVER